MIRPENNDRNRLEDCLRLVGLRPETCIAVDYEREGEQTYVATVTVRLPDAEPRSARGSPTVGKKASTKSACAALLSELEESHPFLFTDWEALRVEAQAGDAIIKLAAYLSPDLPSPAEASRWLQTLESNAHLARVFDSWKEDGHPELEQWGLWLSKERKGTLVEAIIWRSYGLRVVPQDARRSLADVFKQLQSGAAAPIELDARAPNAQ